LYWAHVWPAEYFYSSAISAICLSLPVLWLESALIFSWQACGLLLFQTLFTIDLAGTTCPAIDI